MCVSRHIPLVRLAASAGAVIVSAALAVTAHAAGPPKPSPAVAQYVEMIPTGAGEKPVGAVREKPEALPAKTRALVRSKGGTDSGALTTIATSPALGAPASSSRRGADAPLRSSTVTADKANSSAAAVAALSTAGTGDSVDRTALVGALLMVTAAVVALAVFGRRRAG
jgi:hypothetical protein